LPVQRDSDAIRFSVSSENETRVLVAYVCERNHLPVGHGNLEFRVRDGKCANSHPDLRIQKMAECFLESWLRKTRTSPSEASPQDSTHEPS
ncbi:MAG TPA: hypothetical protein VLL05_12805, partial [Terriglobales bacterium]|nr:hypothetical protein [Terriglobales bacterium]